VELAPARGWFNSPTPRILLGGLGRRSPPDLRPPPLKVYSRRRRGLDQVGPSAPPDQVGPSSPPAAVAPTPALSPPRQLQELRKPIDCLLPPPVVQRRRNKARSGSLPRRSRRVTCANPCSPGPVTTVAQRKVMRNLGFEATEKIDPETQDAYFKTFGQTLSDSHMAAMTAILSWTPEEDLQVRGTGTCFGF